MREVVEPICWLLLGLILDILCPGCTFIYDVSVCVTFVFMDFTVAVREYAPVEMLHEYGIETKTLTFLISPALKYTASFSIEYQVLLIPEIFNEKFAGAEP